MKCIYLAYIGGLYLYRKIQAQKKMKYHEIQWLSKIFLWDYRSHSRQRSICN